ncbi:cysteine hydrolase family protein [Pseudonocardia sp. HH130630-07]|uniref:cysteine hydrolase family protein n=1 Tax=Pseudonocardia sp. HH130630-07 TaxID=1690815 RepID=UPI000814F072|nr:isochorismatase family cysteine hydrolase [Pseudonocardia sp. HH130630-07]ANY06330.1 isochorismatase [Pseudonocardia sp. HH130630-07]
MSPTTALLVGDLQTGLVRDHPFVAGVVPTAVTAVGRARAAGLPVVFVRTALRANRADLPGRNPVLTAFFESGDALHEGGAATEVDPRLAVRPEDVVVVKRRTGAFAGTDLDLVLRARGVRHLVVTGVATGAMVAATVYAASDLDYGLTVLHDACADDDPARHAAFTTSIFPSRGVTVLGTGDWRP